VAFMITLVRICASMVTKLIRMNRREMGVLYMFRHTGTVNYHRNSELNKSAFLIQTLCS
jgi:hypothetical protein